MATQSASSVSISGGSATGMTTVSGTNGAFSEASLGEASCSSLTVPNTSLTLQGNSVSTSLLGLTTAGDWRGGLGLGSLATQNVPSSGYVTSNGTTLSSAASVPSSDIAFTSGFTVTGGEVNLNASSNHGVNI